MFRCAGGASPNLTWREASPLELLARCTGVPCARGGQPVFSESPPRRAGRPKHEWAGPCRGRATRERGIWRRRGTPDGLARGSASKGGMKIRRADRPREARPASPGVSVRPTPLVSPETAARRIGAPAGERVEHSRARPQQPVFPSGDRRAVQGLLVCRKERRRPAVRLRQGAYGPCCRGVPPREG